MSSCCVYMYTIWACVYTVSCVYIRTSSTAQEHVHHTCTRGSLFHCVRCWEWWTSRSGVWLSAQYIPTEHSPIATVVAKIAAICMEVGLASSVKSWLSYLQFMCNFMSAQLWLNHYRKLIDYNKEFGKYIHFLCTCVVEITLCVSYIAVTATQCMIVCIIKYYLNILYYSSLSSNS